jgi:hypothetical protein
MKGLALADLKQPSYLLDLLMAVAANVTQSEKIFFENEPGEPPRELAPAMV